MNFRSFFNFTLVCLGMLLAGGSFSIPSPIYPTEALSRGVSVTQSGVVLGAGFITTFFFTPFTGKLIGKIGTKPVFLLGLTLVGFGNLAFGFIKYIDDGVLYFWLSLTFRVLGTVGESLISPAAYPLGAQNVSPENRGKAVSLVEAFFGIGMSFGPVLGGFLYEAGGFGLPFWLTGGALISLAICGQIFYKDQENCEDGDERVATWKDVLTCNGILMNLIVAAFCGVAQCWYIASMEPYLLERFGIESETTGLVLMAFSLTYTILAPVFGVLFDCGLSPFLGIVIGNLSIILSLLALGPVPGLWFLDNLPVKILSLVLQGIGSASTFIGTLVGTIACAKAGGLPQTERTMGTLTSAWYLSLCLGAFLGSLAGSGIYDLAGFSLSCTSGAIIVGSSVIIAICFSKIPRKSKSYSLSD